MVITLLILTALAAAVDWIAVARGRERVELIAKPLTLALLLAAASAADLGVAKPWVVVALAFGLIGDIALMFSREGAADRPFMAGLGCFLLGHICYIIGFARHGVHGWQVVAGALVVGGATALLMPRVLRAAREAGGGVLAGAVATYSTALATMAVLGVGTAAIATAIGALLFLGSDSTLAWNRFVQPLVRGPIIVIVTYHAAQVLIVIGLIRHT